MKRVRGTLADIQSLFSLVEASADNPRLSEPLTRAGRPVPDSERPAYTWTAVIPEYEADGETPTGNAWLIIPRGARFYRGAWGDARVRQLRPGLPIEDVPARAREAARGALGRRR